MFSLKYVSSAAAAVRRVASAELSVKALSRIASPIVCIDGAYLGVRCQWRHDEDGVDRPAQEDNDPGHRLRVARHNHGTTSLDLRECIPMCKNGIKGSGCSPVGGEIRLCRLCVLKLKGEGWTTRERPSLRSVGIGSVSVKERIGENLAASVLGRGACGVTRDVVAVGVLWIQYHISGEQRERGGPWRRSRDLARPASCVGVVG